MSAKMISLLEKAHTNFYEALDGDGSIEALSSDHEFCSHVHTLYSEGAERQQAAIRAYVAYPDNEVLVATIRTWPVLDQVFYVDVLWMAHVSEHSEV
jgi:hypothetical protein